jgi:hypothetical protein
MADSWLVDTRNSYDADGYAEKVEGLLEASPYFTREPGVVRRPRPRCRGDHRAVGVGWFERTVRRRRPHPEQLGAVGLLSAHRSS